MQVFILPDFYQIFTINSNSQHLRHVARMKCHLLALLSCTMHTEPSTVIWILKLKTGF